MRRAEKVLEKTLKMKEDGRKPSVKALSSELEYPEDDIHRCLNVLERQNKVRTYAKRTFRGKMRMVETE